jgi:hypothetical protein
MNIRYDVTRTQQALQFLVDSPYGSRHIQRIKALVEKPRALPFQDEADSLNELLVIGRQSRDVLDKLIDVVEYKRRNRGSYQRDFMATKRARERKVIQLESILRDKSLNLDERVLVLKQYYEQWGKAKEEFIVAREPASWMERNEVIREFWAGIDKELDKKLATAREQQERVVTKKQVVHTSWFREPTTLLGQKLKEAMHLPTRGTVRLDRHQ